ncbi:N-6 DNA methylase [Maribellus comscasis]|nr:N-6 DNA methylase [Maribellus comscasis]
MEKNPNIPQLFRDIFNNAYLPYRDPETLKLFLKTIAEFEYTHSEKLGDAFEYLLSVMGSQGDAGQFRTPRHIIDFLVAIVDPQKTDTILDPACGTAGFLISAFKYIRGNSDHRTDNACVVPTALTPDEQKKLINNIRGYDISPDMVRLSLVNLYLHGFSDPHINEYDTLSSEERWDEYFDVVLANPPFMSPKGGIRPHKKFTIKSNRSEVLFVDYIAEHLNPKGRAGVIVPEGVIFQSGTAYKDLRKMLVKNYLYAVVSLPAGVFNPYSGVKTSILLMDKEIAKSGNEILFVKIDNDGYNLGAQRTAIKGGQLDEAIEDIKKFRNGDFADSTISHAVLRTEIGSNGEYNLSGERYKSVIYHHSSFEMVALSDEVIFKVVSGGTPDSKNEEYWNGDINWATLVDLPATDLISNISSTERKITEAGLKNSSAKILPPNSVIVSTRATIGRIAINETECSTNQGFKNIIIQDTNKANTYFVALMMTQLIEKMNSMATGGTFKELSTTNFRTLEIPLPPLSVQEEIVAEIEGYQKIIDGAKMVVSTYKPKIDIDPDWEIKNLGDISEFKNGLNFSKESKGEKIKILGVSHFKDNLVAPISELEETQVDETINESYLLQKGDLVFVRSNGNADLVGRSMIIPEINERISFSGFTIRCRLNEGIEPLYIGYLFKSELHRNLMKNTGRGANIRNLSQGILGEISIPIPPINIQQEIVKQLEKEQDLINANKQLIELFEQKIKDRIAKVWGTSSSLGTGGEKAEKEQALDGSAEPSRSMAAEPKTKYKTN